jgi:hypothetical protein
MEAWLKQAESSAHNIHRDVNSGSIYCCKLECAVLNADPEKSRLGARGGRWYKRANYKSGSFYNEVYVVTREPSGLPSTTPVLMANGKQKTMDEIFRTVVAKRLGKFTLKFGDMEYIPLEKPLKVISKGKDGKKHVSKIQAVMRQPPPKVPYIRLMTASGKELLCDPQRGFYVRRKGYERLYRADRLRIGMKILAFDENTESTIEDPITSLERVSLKK